MIYGYARVSTDGQSLDAQVKQLRAAGAEKVFRETASGARADRAQLRRVLVDPATGWIVRSKSGSVG
jgi:DNA invertase Pin-like site-specific DNA recombinase